MWLFYLLLCGIAAAELIWRPRLDLNRQTWDLLLWYNDPETGRKFKKVI